MVTSPTRFYPLGIGSTQPVYMYLDVFFLPEFGKPISSQPDICCQANVTDAKKLIKQKKTMSRYIWIHFWYILWHIRYIYALRSWIWCIPARNSTNFTLICIRGYVKYLTWLKKYMWTRVWTVWFSVQKILQGKKKYKIQ